MDVRKTARTERAKRTRHGMEMWNIYLVERLAERKGSIVSEGQAREGFCFDVTGACDIPRSGRGCKGWSVLPFPFTVKTKSELCLLQSYSLEAHPSPNSPAFGPCMPRCLSAMPIQPPSHPQHNDTDRVTHSHPHCLPRKFHQPPSHQLHKQSQRRSQSQAPQSVAQLCGEARRRAGGWQLAQRVRSITRLA